MTRKDFIKKFELEKVGRIHVICGRESWDRTLYTNKFGHNFVFVNNDLYSVRLSDRKDGIGYLGAGYKWYH